MNAILVFERYLLTFRGHMVNKRWKDKEVNKHTGFINSVLQTGDTERGRAFNLNMLLLSTHATLHACDRRVLSANHTQLSGHGAEAPSLPTPCLSQPLSALLSATRHNIALLSCSSPHFAPWLHCSVQTIFSYLGQIFLLQEISFRDLPYWQNGEDGLSAALCTCWEQWVGIDSRCKIITFTFPRLTLCSSCLLDRLHRQAPSTYGCFSAWWTRQRNPHWVWSTMEVGFLVPVWTWFQHEQAEQYFVIPKKTTGKKK